MNILVKSLLASTALLAVSATAAQARTNLNIDVGIGAPLYAPPVVYEQVPVVPVYRPYYPVGYRDGHVRHRDYDYGYWERQRHDQGRHEGWENHGEHDHR